MTPRSPFPSESWSNQPSSEDGGQGLFTNGSGNGDHPEGTDAERIGSNGQNGSQAGAGEGDGNGAVPVGDGFAVSEHFVEEHEDAAPDEQERISDLEDRVERLSSICEAMWDLVSEELDLELSGLTARLAEINASELMPPIAAAEEGSICPNCGNPKPAAADLCLFCSARHPVDDDR